MAGEYWLLKHAFGWSITEHRYPVVRTILLTVNGLLLVVYLIFLARLVEQFGTSDWGRLFVLAAGCFATFLTTFANTLNNHNVAACCALFALYPALQIWYRGERGVAKRMDRLWSQRFDPSVPTSERYVPIRPVAWLRDEREASGPRATTA